MDQVKFVEKPLKNLKRYSLLNRPYHFKFFKNCIPQTLLDSFLNKLSIALLETFQSNQNTTFFPSALFRVTFMLESDEAPFFFLKKKTWMQDFHFGNQHHFAIFSELLLTKVICLIYYFPKYNEPSIQLRAFQNKIHVLLR